MKKISILLIVVIIFNFIFGNVCNKAYATDELEGQETLYTKESYDKLIDEGIVNLNGSDEKLDISISSTGSISGILASLLTTPCAVVSVFMSRLANDGGFFRTESDNSAFNNQWFTVNSLLFGEYLLFNHKLYETTETLEPTLTPTSIMSIENDIKGNATNWLNIIKYVALGLFLALLTYGGIRIFMATTANDIARWKKIVFTWVIGLIFIFLLQQIIIFLDAVADLIMDILWTIRLKLELKGYKSFEVEIMRDLMKYLTETGGMQAFAYSAEYIAYVIFQLMFFVKYFVRAFKLMLLTIIAPIIAVLHTFNIISDNKRNLLQEWAMQYLSLLLMQPLHALIYLIFIFTVGEIAINAPLLGLVFLWVVLRAEKIIKVMLTINEGKKMSLFSKGRKK